MRVLITGANGFLGRHLLKRFLDMGHEVIGMALDNGFDERAEFLKCDVTKTIPTIAGEIDIIAHLASNPSPKKFMSEPISTLHAESTGTENMLQLAMEKGAVFFYPSSAQVYSSRDPGDPRAVYAEGKRYGEALVSTYQREFKVRTKIARLFNTYGPGMRRQDGRVIPTFIEMAMEGKDITLFGGMQRVSFTYVDDMIDALMALILSDETGPLDLGSVEQTKIIQVAKEVIRQTKSRSSITVQYGDFKDERKPDEEGIARLGWKAETDIKEGIKRTVDWFKGVQN